MGLTSLLAIGLAAVGVLIIALALSVIFGWAWGLLVIGVAITALGLEELLR